MSDWDDEMYDDDEEEELSFEESDVDDSDQMDQDEADGNKDNIDLESQYYLGKDYRQDENYDRALTTLEKNISYRTEPEYADNVYIFKSLKQAIKTSFDSNKHEKVLEFLTLIFEQLPKVDRAYGESSISKILYRFDLQKAACSNKFIESYYNLFSTYLEEKNNGNNNSVDKRLYIKIGLGKANVLIVDKQYDEASGILSHLENLVLQSTEQLKNSFLLEVLASEMIIATDKDFDLKQLTRLTNLAHSSASGIPQSRIVGIVNECSGIVSMHSEDFRQANEYFQESFKGFNECGDIKRIGVLVEFIVSNLLSESEVNPFKSSDFQGFIKLDAIARLMEVYNSVHDTNIDEYNSLTKDTIFENILKEYQFLKEFLPFVTELIQKKFIVKYLSLFSKVSFQRLTTKLQIEDATLELLIVKLNNVGVLSGVKLNLVDKILFKDEAASKNILKENLKPKDVVRSIQYYHKSSSSLDNFSNEIRKLQASFMTSSAETMTSNLKIKTEFHGDSEYDFPLDSDSIPRGARMMHGGQGRPPPTVEKYEKFEPGYADLFQPFKQLDRNLLSDLFIASLKPGKKQYHTKDQLENNINKYLSYLRTSVPIKEPQKLSHLERVKKDQIETEAKNIREDVEKETNDIDPYVPEILQSSLMNNLEAEPDDGEKAEDITAEEIQRRKVRAIERLLNSLVTQLVSYKMGFNEGLKVDTGDGKASKSKIKFSDDGFHLDRSSNYQRSMRFESDELSSVATGYDEMDEELEDEDDY